MVIRAKQISFGVYGYSYAYLDGWLYKVEARHYGDGVRLCVTYK